jgi:hypothetical protein
MFYMILQAGRKSKQFQVGLHAFMVFWAFNQIFINWNHASFI